MEEQVKEHRHLHMPHLPHHEHHELTPEETEALIAQFDRESNVRRFSGVPDKIVKGLLVLFSAYILLVTIRLNLAEQQRRTIFMGALVFIGYLLYPAKRGLTHKVNHVPWYDIVFAAAGSGCFFYFTFNANAIIGRAALLNQTDIVIGIIGIVLLAELCRRVVGFPILVVAGAFVIYAFAAGYSLRRIIGQLFYTTDGVIGTPVGVCSTFIVLFILLAAFLEKSGIASFFIDMANSVAGWTAGGPAKVAVIASALMGMYSGSSVANTVGSGSVTIPVMKKTGYKPEFAAAVEAAASTGGQIMPPIMGAAAFLMAELTGISYPKIAVAAILPAVLYFTGIFLMVHFEAKKLGLNGIPKEQIPHFGKLFLRKGYLFLPVVVLVVLMSVGGFTSAYAAVFAILTALVVSFFHKDTRFTRSTFVDALAAGTKNTIGVAMACAMAGIVIGVVSLTGLGQILISTLLQISQGSLLLALFLTMISCIVLGMGIPTTANYVIMATITAPIVMGMEIAPGVKVPILAAHMFVFYFGIVADITPPVALAAYAGSAIAKCNPIKAGVNATRLAITAFIIPYMFVFNPAMLFIDTTPLEVLRIVTTSVIGMLGLAVGIEGFFLRHINVLERLMAIAGGLLLIHPGAGTDAVGIVLIALIIVVQNVNGRRHGKQKLNEKAAENGTNEGKK